MHAELLRLAAELAEREEPFVLAVVVRRRPASSAQAGDMAVITAAGEFHGWLGGSCTQPVVVQEARRALADGRPRLLALAPDPEAERRPGVAVFPMTCHSGGTVEIYLDPILPAARLLVFGGSPTAQALVKLGKAMGYSVFAVDTAPEPAIFPEADRVLGDPAAAELAAALSAAIPHRGEGGGGGCFAVVATMGEGDEEAIRAALALRPAYLGVVASARRFAEVRERLLARGLPAAALATIRSPAGVAIGARTPEEIAVSVLAEIVARRQAPAAAAAVEDAAAAGVEEATAAAVPDAAVAVPDAAAVAAGTEIAAGERSAETAAPATFERDDGGEPPQETDPVCGMTVEVAGARHTAEAGGRTWYFCGGGCRERFLAAPGSFAAAVQSPAPGRPGRSSGAA
jgi:xanthine dehydrogenase accessory factor